MMRCDRHDCIHNTATDVEVDNNRCMLLFPDIKVLGKSTSGMPIWSCIDEESPKNMRAPGGI